MDYQRGKDRNQVFLTSMDQMVDPDSWARVADLFVDTLPIAELGFTTDCARTLSHENHSSSRSNNNA